MNIIRMEDNDVKNLLAFLDRVGFQGLDELQAMNKILQCINERATELAKESKSK